MKVEASKVQYLRIDEANEGQRLDNYLLGKFRRVPRSRIYRAVRKGEVRVNGKRSKQDRKLELGDQIRLPPLQQTAKTTIGEIPSKIRSNFESSRIYEDEHTILIDKPAGIAVHGGTKRKFGVIEVMRSLYPETQFLELVHRLDVDTSGCLLLAKSRSSLLNLHAQLRERKIKKSYLMLVKGKWKGGEVRIETLLKRGKSRVSVNDEGKPAITDVSPLWCSENMSLLCANLITGRMHQLRVHLAHHQHPIIGDDLYGDFALNKIYRNMGLRRIFLHASDIEWICPRTNQRITHKVSLSPELVRFMDNAGILSALESMYNK